MSFQSRELFAAHGTRLGSLLVGLCGVGVSSGCGSSHEQLFDDAGHTSGGIAQLGGMSATLGGSVSSGGSSTATGGASATSGGSSTATGGASATSGGSSSASGGGTGIEMGGVGGDGSAGDPGVSGSGGADPSGGSTATGGAEAGAGAGGAPVATGGTSSTGGASVASGGTSGAATGGGGGGDPAPVVESGSRTLAAFKGLLCESVTFPNAFAAPDADIHVQVSAVHPGAARMHGALAVWIQSVTATGFEACLTEDAGLNSSHLESRLDWVAYVAPSVASLGGAAGRLALGAVKGRSCHSVRFASAFATAPQLQITANHQGAPKAPNDASSAWAEELSASGFRVCVEELEGADGELDGTNVDWLAYPGTFTGAGFSAGERNLTAFDGVQCVEIATGCANCENIQLSLNHRRRTEAATSSHNATLVWAEDMTVAGTLTACVTQTSGYDASADGHLSIDWLTRKTND